MDRFFSDYDFILTQVTASWQTQPVAKAVL